MNLSVTEALPLLLLIHMRKFKEMNQGFFHPKSIILLLFGKLPPRSVPITSLPSNLSLVKYDFYLTFWWFLQWSAQSYSRAIMRVGGSNLGGIGEDQTHRQKCQIQNLFITRARLRCFLDLCQRPWAKRFKRSKACGDSQFQSVSGCTATGQSQGWGSWFLKVWRSLRWVGRVLSSLSRRQRLRGKGPDKICPSKAW